MSALNTTPKPGTIACLRELKSFLSLKAMIVQTHVRPYRMKVPRFEARAMPVKPTTLWTPTMPITETATMRATRAMWGVLNSG